MDGSSFHTIGPTCVTLCPSRNHNNIAICSRRTAHSTAGFVVVHAGYEGPAIILILSWVKLCLIQETTVRARLSTALVHSPTPPRSVELLLSGATGFGTMHKYSAPPPECV